MSSNTFGYIADTGPTQAFGNLPRKYNPVKATISIEYLVVAGGGGSSGGNDAPGGGIGYTYDETNDVFYAPKPYESWSISESTNWLWKCPVDYPIDNNQNNPDTSLPKKFYKWNEENQEWDLSYTVTYNTETKEWIVDE